MRATVRHIDGMTLLGISESNHIVATDAPAAAGGSGSAASPLEHLLMALGGCSAMDVLTILKKKRISVDHFEIQLEGQRRDEHPRILTDVKLNYVFRGSGLEEKRKHLEDAVLLSQEKYCSVAGMLIGNVNLTWQVTVAD